MTPEITPQEFRERFALATFPDGGIVADLTTGSYSRLNATGAILLDLLQNAGSLEAAIDAVAARFAIPRERAALDMSTLYIALGQEGPRTEAPDPLRYRRASDGGYDLWHGELHALHVDPLGRRLVLGSPAEELPFEVYDYVSDVAPKVMFLQGTPILHGSSWRGNAGLLGMCGKSRAGKTTTARALARHGGTLISEDLIVLSPGLEVPSAVVGAEAKVMQWSRSAARELERNGAATVNADTLRDATIGPAVPLERIWFLDARRRGSRFELSSLTRTAALAELMSHAFLGAAGEASGRRYLAACHSIISSVTAHEAALPEGLDRLDEAMGPYATNSAS